MKAGYLRRNGSPTSDEANLTFHFIRHGDMLVVISELQDPIYLSEPRISGVHATLKLEGGQLLVRDETSNNGTWIAGSRLAPGAWTQVPPGAPLRFGPVEFEVELAAS